MKGIVQLSNIPLRTEASGKSELCSQLLAGETYEVIEEKGEWLRIKNDADGYEGYINANQFAGISDFLGPAKRVCNYPFLVRHSAEATAFFPCGALVYEDIEGLITLPGIALIEFSKQFLNVPYLWGGKTAFGIDCSGFVQVMFSCFGVQMPRDAWQQAQMGEHIDFVASAMPGDLAFFENEAGNIVHVGICLNDNQIIHASGKVRIDQLDGHGIYNRHLAKHTHKLKWIKRTTIKTN